MVYIVKCLKEKRFKRKAIYRIIYVSIFSLCRGFFIGMKLFSRFYVTWLIGK